MKRTVLLYAAVQRGASGRLFRLDTLRRPLSAWRRGAGQVDTLFAGTNDAIESFGRPVM